MIPLKDERLQVKNHSDQKSHGNMINRIDNSMASLEVSPL